MCRMRRRCASSCSTGRARGRAQEGGEGLIPCRRRPPPPNHPLRLLHLEDSELDHELTLAHLQRGGLQVEALRVDSEAEYLSALEQPWDVIVSDYNLPGF